MAKKETKTNAMRILERLKIPYTHKEYECDEFTDGSEIAEKLGLSHEEVFKTLVTLGSGRIFYCLETEGAYPCSSASLQFRSAFRAVIKILRGLISACWTMPDRSVISKRQRSQIAIPDRDHLAFGDALSHFRIQLVGRPTAVHFHKVFLSPLEAGNKEEQKLHEGHVNTIGSISGAPAAYHSLVEVQIFSAVVDSDDKEHMSFNPPMRCLQILCFIV